MRLTEPKLGVIDSGTARAARPAEAQSSRAQPVLRRDAPTPALPPRAARRALGDAPAEPRHAGDVTARVIATTRELVAIPSQGGIDSPGPICAALVRRLDEAGLTPRVLEDASGAPVGVVAEVQLGGPGPTYVLNAVVDTAPVGDAERWRTKAPFAATQSGEWLVGRGVADSKAAAAIYIEVGRALAARAGELRGRAVLFFDAAEHAGDFRGVEALLAAYQQVDGVVIGYCGNTHLSVGSRGFYRATARAELAVPGDVASAARFLRAVARAPVPDERTLAFPLPPKLTQTAVHTEARADVAVAPGMELVEIRVAGRAAHSGASSRGAVNAIDKAASILEAVASPDTASPARLVSVTGGELFSQVPDAVVVMLLVPRGARTALAAAMEQADTQAPAGVPSRLRVQTTDGRAPLLARELAVNLDVRVTPSFDERSAAEHLARTFAGLSGATVALEPRGSWPAFVLPEGSPLRRAMEGAIAEVTQAPTQSKITGPSNVGNLLAARGIPATTGFGVRGRSAHAPNEAIDVGTIQAAYDVHLKAMEALHAPRVAAARAEVAVPELGWTAFASGRHAPGKGYTYFQGTQGELLDLVRAHWDKRKPGQGHTALDKVVVVPVPPERFVGTTAAIADGMQLEAEVKRRRPHEDPFVGFSARVAPDPVRFASVVLYHRDHLAGDGPVDFKGEWGVVAILGTPVEDEPMHPLSMARNMLEKPGGSKASYTAEEFARAVYYWSQRVSTR